MIFIISFDLKLLKEKTNVDIRQCYIVRRILNNLKQRMFLKENMFLIFFKNISILINYFVFHIRGKWNLYFHILDIGNKL